MGSRDRWGMLLALARWSHVVAIETMHKHFANEPSS